MVPSITPSPSFSTTGPRPEPFPRCSWWRQHEGVSKAIRTRPYAFWASQRVGWRVLRWAVFLVWLVIVAGGIGVMIHTALFARVIDASAPAGVRFADGFAEPSWIAAGPISASSGRMVRQFPNRSATKLPAS